MPVSPRRAIPWVFALVFVALATVGLAPDADAQVFQGPLDFFNLPPMTMTVTIQPSGPATYTIQLGDFVPGSGPSSGGNRQDRGFVVASVVGGNVTGYFQTIQFPNIRPCIFQGVFDGTTARLSLDPVSCGGGGTLTLTRIS
jgi:hypothetical protein